ncbi:hypothetical protein ABZW11_15645 [Nonomuraea sp. NPDC004580]|uniref:hypothetical protein n=1 Tax=Nonomuraea sp. NPDC004580 TaxID=3154552 RepID=UPI00339EF02E
MTGDAITEASSRVYEQLRDGDLDYATLLDLVIVLDDHGVSTPATREFLESDPAPLCQTADLSRVAEAVLRETSFEPPFELEPGWWHTLEEALAVVERDARATGVTGTLRLNVPDWDPQGYARVEFRGAYQGNGMAPSTGSDPVGALAEVADAAQEVIVEMIWRAWPVCPEHDRGLWVAYQDETVVWRCTYGGAHLVAAVGELPSV